MPVDIYKRTGEQNGGYGWEDGLIDALWNRDINDSKQTAYDSYREFQKVLQDYADNYPTFKTTMQKEGMLNADGSINARKFIDKGYLEDLRQRYEEGSNAQAQSMIRANALANVRGQGSGASIASIGKTLGDSQRNMLRDYANANKSERETAYNKAMTIGSKYQQDALGQAQANINSAKNTAEINANIAKSQSAGLLQDPERLIGLAQTIGGIASMNPSAMLGGASKLTTTNKTGGFNPVLTNAKGETEDIPYQQSLDLLGNFYKDQLLQQAKSRQYNPNVYTNEKKYKRVVG